MTNEMHWTHFEHIINHINTSKNPANELSNFTVILLSKLKLDIGQMSDAVQEGFLFYENISQEDREGIAKEFDSYLVSLKN